MIKLRVYKNQMQNDIEKFFEQCCNDLGWEYSPQDWHSDILNIQEKYMSNGCFWCLYDSIDKNDKKLIGTVAVWTIDIKNKIAELKRLYVLKEYQGKGYGELLFKTALDYVKSNGYKKVCADTDKNRHASQHLMKKYNFHEIKRYNDNQKAEMFFELDL
ncbi:MAG: GNAT family N-acetyltransferase [Oscillospiraceae bacterium]|nr:GNAT family N-acetyltransferase [Oscillospiraceae bacterium]